MVEPVPESQDYATREELNYLVNMVVSVNTTVTDFIGKFSSFQQNVSSSINEINARVSMLEESVKVIKDNI